MAAPPPLSFPRFSSLVRAAVLLFCISFLTPPPDLWGEQLLHVCAGDSGFWLPPFIAIASGWGFASRAIGGAFVAAPFPFHFSGASLGMLLLSVGLRASDAQVVTSLAGSGAASFGDGSGTSASFLLPSGLAINVNGNSGNGVFVPLGTIYVADSRNNRIRTVTPGGIVSSLAGSGVQGFADGTGVAAMFSVPSDVAIDSSGNIFVADSNNHCLRKVTPIGVVTTLAGDGVARFVEGTGTGASFHFPFSVAVDSSDAVYVADQDNNRIRKVAPGGAVTTLAGSGAQGYADGIGLGAVFNGPWGVATDASNNVYVSDTFNGCIRRVTPSGLVSTLAGNPAVANATGLPVLADGAGTNARFGLVAGLIVDTGGNIYVADAYFESIRKVSPSGVVTTYAGNGEGTYLDGTGTGASFALPLDVAFDFSGNLFVADAQNNRIRKIAPLATPSPTPTVTTTPPATLSNTGRASSNLTLYVAIGASLLVFFVLGFLLRKWCAQKYRKKLILRGPSEVFVVCPGTLSWADVIPLPSPPEAPPVQGAMGIVLAAMHRASGRKVAVKVFKVAQQQLSGDSAVDLLQKEFAAMQRASEGGLNEFVVKPVGVITGAASQPWTLALGPLVASCISENSLYGLVMKWEEGGTLAELLHKRPWGAKMADRLLMCAQLASGVSALHAANVVHGDVRPLPPTPPPIHTTHLTGYPTRPRIYRLKVKTCCSATAPTPRARSSPILGLRPCATPPRACQWAAWATTVARGPTWHPRC